MSVKETLTPKTGSVARGILHASETDETLGDPDPTVSDVFLSSAARASRDTETRDVLIDAMAGARERLGFKLLAWVVMPEHVHLLIVPMQEPVPVILRSIKQTTSQRILYRWKQSGARVLGTLNVGGGRTRFWQAGGGFDRNVRDTAELARTVEYIHENPVKRELAISPTDWAWSSARSYAQWDGTIPYDKVHWSCH